MTEKRVASGCRIWGGGAKSGSNTGAVFWGRGQSGSNTGAVFGGRGQSGAAFQMGVILKGLEERELQHLDSLPYHLSTETVALESLVSSSLGTT